MSSVNDRVETDDLVLAVTKDFDPQKIRLDSYEPFIDALCQDREYQKDAIRDVCRFLGGGQYESTSQLARQNFDAHPAMEVAYGSLATLYGRLPFPDKLACSVDLATGTGKSFVMYGIARILLAEGVVDRVLVLCPSLTIEAGLTDKFERLSADRALLDLIPFDAVCRLPDITNADATTQPGQICIENIDATYKHVRSSVRDSFAGNGSTTLVLNDESHHILSPPTGQTAIKRWMSFLQDDEFGFARIVGFSGTSYVGDSYFSDVVSRYSLRQAVEDGIVKSVQYVERDDSSTDSERFQKYLQLHNENRTKYRDLKPLSILVAARVQTAQHLADEFVDFLSLSTGMSHADAARTVLVVTSDSAHKRNLARLPYVDRADDPVEWIFSVSMLTEGWDVNNVFQIIPHEKRAFNSKLLIAQVLGRGLRVPPGVVRPVVSVFNHSKWAKEIRGLVNEVLELELRLHSYSVSDGVREAYHFDLHQLSYATETTEQDLPLRDVNGEVQLFTRGYVNFQSQPAKLTRETIFADLVTGNERVLKTVVSRRGYTTDEVIQRLRGRLKSVDMEEGTSYAKKYTADFVRKVLTESLSRIDEDRDLVSEENLQHTLRAVGNTQRTLARTVRVKLVPDQLFTVSTRDMRSRSVALTAFRKEASIFIDSESLGVSQEADVAVFRILMEEDSPYPNRAVISVENRYRWKSPVNAVVTSHAPERAFVRRLFSADIAECLAAWIKSPDVGFYEIAYSWRMGDHTKQGKFNPDFFLRLANEDRILVVELKADGDVTEENRAKLRDSRRHFESVNAECGTPLYGIQFLSPQDFDGFFQSIRDGRGSEFVSQLEAALSD